MKSVFNPLLKRGFQKLLDLLESYITADEKGAVNGVATLDENMKITASQLPDWLLGQVHFSGLFDAQNYIPKLPMAPDSSYEGKYYIVSAAGSFMGISFEIGDWCIFSGGQWRKVDNTDAVSTVFGRTGNVQADAGDYAAFYASLALANTFTQKQKAPQFESTSPTGTPPFIIASQTQVPNLFASFAGLLKSIVYANGNPQRDARDRLTTAGVYSIYATNTSTNFPENTFSGIKFQFADGVDTVGDFIMGKGDSTLSNFYFRFVQSVASGIGTWSGWLTIWNAGNSNDLTKDWRARILFAGEKVDALRGVFGSSVKVGYDSDAASSTNAGAIRYNNSLTPGIVEMVLKNADGNYSWQKIKPSITVSATEPATTQDGDIWIVP